MVSLPQIDRPRFQPGTREAYAVTLLIFAVALAPRLLLRGHGVGIPFFTFFPAVLLTIFLCGSRAAIVTVALSIGAAWLFVLPPDVSYLTIFQTMAFIIGSFTIAAVVSLMRATGEQVHRLNATLRRELATRREIEVRLEEASRAKSDFLARMSHELRTPLNAIIGFSELISEAVIGPLDARYREYGRDINGAGRHLQNIINDILDIAKLESGRLELRDETVSIDEAVEACRRIVAAMADSAGVALATDIPAAMPFIRSDELRFRQILLNLMSNAVKFTPSGGSVRVSAAVEREGAVIAVADTGIGMKAESIPIALEPFRQIDGALSRRFDGTGLGLPLAKALVELHGGRLQIESAPGKGTTVRIWLPLDRVVDAAA